MRIGDRIEGRYFEKENWHEGKITSINPDGTIDIKYDSEMWNGWTALTEYGVKAGFFKHKTGGANSEMGDKPLPPPSVAPPAPPSHPPNSSEFHIGQRVEAKPEGKSKWFGATVMHVNNDGNSFKIKYDSGLWNAWMPVNDPKVHASNIRCHAGERDSAFDHSPIRKANDEPATATPGITRNNSTRGRKSSTGAATVPERMTRAQAAKAEKEALKASETPAPPPPSTTKKNTNYAVRETNAMRAQREAAMKRRETLETNELKKYGETFESKKEQKLALQQADAKKHTFLKRADSNATSSNTSSYTARVGASSSQHDDNSSLTLTNKTPGGGGKRLSASNQYRSNQAQQEQEMQQAQKQLKQQKQKEEMKKQQKQQQLLQKQSSLQEKQQQRDRGQSPGAGTSSNKGRSQTVDDTSKSSSLTSSSTSSKKANNDQANASVAVIIRKRPAKEGETDVVKCYPPVVICNENKVKVDLTKYVYTHKFCYDNSFGDEHTTLDLYDQSISNLIDNFMGGGSSTCFCFGQTASGKTFTLFGAGGGQVMEDGDERANPEDGGVYMLAAQAVFAKLQSNPELTLSVSMFEIYGQKVRDLLDSGKELAALEDGKGVLQLVGLTGEECDNMSDFIHVSNVGRLARSTTATGANATSSRSHAAMLLRLVKRGPVREGKQKPSFGKFSLIDLAGSERGADNENTDKTTQMEGRQINQSLLALKEVIRAKELGRSHAPFRQSRLTQVLEESLTGRKCQTVVIGCISPNEKDIQQTVNTLRYAEGLRPGLKKDMAKKEKEAMAREQIRLEALEQEQDQLTDPYYVDHSSDRGNDNQHQSYQDEMQLSEDLIAQKERELLQERELMQTKREEREKKMKQDREEELQLLQDDEMDELENDIYRESINPITLNLMDEEEDDDLRASPSIDLDDDTSYRRASALQNELDDEDDDEYEECVEEEDENNVNGYKAYNGSGDVTDMLREQDKAEVEALLAKQDRTLRDGGKYSTNQSNTNRRQAAASKKGNSKTTSNALSLQSPKRVNSPAKVQADTIAQYEVENLDTTNDKNTKSKKLPPTKLTKTPSNVNRQSKTQIVTTQTNNKNITSTPGNMRGKSNSLRQSLDDNGSNSMSGQSIEAEVAALQWRLSERDAELIEKDKLIESLSNRVQGLNKAVEESDTIRAQQAISLKRERDRIESVERTYHEAMMKLEADIDEVQLERDGLYAELEDKDTEVNQLVAEVEDREARNNELKLMLKKLLETQAPTPTSASSLGHRNSMEGDQRTTRSATKNKK